MKGLKFNRAGSLFLDSTLDDILNYKGQNGFVDRTLHKWSGQKISDIYLFSHNTASDHNPEQVKTVKKLQDAGFEVATIQISDISKNENQYYHTLSEFIVSKLRIKPALFLFSQPDSENIFSYTAILLLHMNLKGKYAAPENLIQHLTGREELLEADIRVFQYKHFLDQAYQIPSQVLEFAGIEPSISAPPVEEPTPLEVKAEKIPETEKPDIASEKTQTITTGTNVEPEVKSELEAEVKVEPETKVETEAKGEPETKVETEAKVEPETKVETEAKVEPETKVEAENETIPANKSAAPEEEQSSATTKAIEITTPPSPAPVTTQASNQTGEEEVISSKDRNLGFFTIRNKLLLITSAVIVLSLSGMILLASSFFRKDNEIRIVENSLALTQALGEKVEAQLENLSYRAASMVTVLQDTSQSEDQRLFNVQQFFENNKQFIYLGLVVLNNNTPKFQSVVYNDKFLRENSLTRKQVDDLVQRNNTKFQRVFNGQPAVQNMSSGFILPVLGLGLPVGGSSQKRMVLAVVEPSRLINSFKAKGITSSFMVSEKGDIIAHEDPKKVLAAANVEKLPIVEKMLQGSPNGKMDYEDKDIEYMGSFVRLNFSGLGVISTVEKDRAFEAVDNIQRRNIYIMVIVVTLAILIVFFFSRTLSIPIVKLVGATQKVEGGEFELDIEPSARDEIGLLTESFTRMAHGLEERRRLQDTVEKMTDIEIARRAMAGELGLGGEKKDCAIFFSDLRGFTAMSEKMLPEEVIHYLNLYFTAMVKCVKDTHGTIDKFIGDAIMAHWGAIISIGDPTENATNAGLYMREALIQFNKMALKEDLPFAKFGCGINTGSVISGGLGSKERFEYTVIGDAVNLASRIEALNKPFGTDVLISQESYDLVKDIFNVEQMPAITVKGKSEPQIIYAVLGRKDDANCPESMEEVRKLTGGDPPKVDLNQFSDSSEDKFEITG